MNVKAARINHRNESGFRRGVNPILLDCLNPENGAYSFSWNVGNYKYAQRNIPDEQRSQPLCPIW